MTKNIKENVQIKRNYSPFGEGMGWAVTNTALSRTEFAHLYSKIILCCSCLPVPYGAAGIVKYSPVPQAGTLRDCVGPRQRVVFH